MIPNLYEHLCLRSLMDSQLGNGKNTFESNGLPAFTSPFGRMVVASNFQSEVVKNESGFTQSLKKALKEALNRSRVTTVKDVADSLDVGHSTLQKWMIKSKNQEFEPVTNKRS